MLAMLGSGEFTSSDAFLAFVGLDLRVRDSGKHKGERKLSKRGDPEARKLLYMAALTACQQPGPFSEFRARYLEAGRSKTEAAVIVARKLARVAWAVYTKQQPYDEQRVLNQPSKDPKTSNAPQIPITYRAANPQDKQIANTVIARARTRPSIGNHSPTKPNAAENAQQHTLDSAA